jgi:hypothetical protein
MSTKRLQGGALLLASAVLVSFPRASTASDGSNRKVISCNVDGTYTCVNEKCEPGYCCQIGGME